MNDQKWKLSVLAFWGMRFVNNRCASALSFKVESKKCKVCGSTSPDVIFPADVRTGDEGQIK